jgi:hypothetical protein
VTDTIRRLTSRSLVLLAIGALAACTGKSDAEAAGAGAPQGNAPTIAAGATTSAGPHGKYGCIQSVPRMVNGSWEYEAEQRGFITLTDGRYTDPYQVAGTYRHDAATDSTFFTGAALDGGIATPLEERRLWVVIPVADGREDRWTCGPA